MWDEEKNIRKSHGWNISDYFTFDSNIQLGQMDKTPEVGH